jgi:hypothetical protein
MEEQLKVVLTKFATLSEPVLHESIFTAASRVEN